MTWRPARSLQTLHAQLKRAAPRAVPPATNVDDWGLIGDAFHDPTSDHTPHDFPGWGNDIVTAADFPNRPDLGLDAHAVLDDIRRSRDKRAKYGISNGQIFSNHTVTQDGVSYPAWTWRPYKSSGDRHLTHGHLSVVGNVTADGEQPWATIGGTVELPGTSTPNHGANRTDVEAFADLANFRAVMIGEKTSKEAGYPDNSPLALLVAFLKHPPAAVVTDGQLGQLADLVAGRLGVLRFVADQSAAGAPTRPADSGMDGGR